MGRTQIIIFFIFLRFPVAIALTLTEAHRIAVQKAERIAQSQAAVEEAQAEYKRRLSVVFPTLSLSAAELIQDVPSASTSDDVLDTFVRRSTPGVSLELKYYIFSGFKEFNGLDIGRAFVRQEKYNKQRSIQLLYSEVATPFYGVIRAMKGLEIYEHRKSVLQDRVNELRRFEKIGRSRPSERLTIEADLKRLEADNELLQASLKSQMALLEFWVGNAANEPLKDELSDGAPLPPLSQCIEDTKKRPDLESLRESLVGLEKQVEFEQGEYWPTVDLRAHYYPYQVGFRDQVDWDFGFFLNYNFFQGGLTRATVAKARAGQRQVDYQLKEAERQAAVEVKTRYTDVESAIARLKALKQAVALDQENYKLQSKEYRLGLVTNLDVLNALNNLNESEWAMEQTRFDGKTQWVNLTVARGIAPKGDAE